MFTEKLSACYRVRSVFYAFLSIYIWHNGKETSGFVVKKIKKSTKSGTKKQKKTFFKGFSPGDNWVS